MAALLLAHMLIQASCTRSGAIRQRIGWAAAQNLETLLSECHHPFRSCSEMPEIPKKSDERGSEDDAEDDLPTQQKFLAIVYSCAFLLSLGNGFLGSRTSFIAVNWFAEAPCDDVDAAKCDDRIPFSCICKAALTRYATVSSATSFASVGFAVCIIPFLTRLSDAFGRRIFIQVIQR